MNLAGSVMLVRLRPERLGNCRIDAPAAIWRNRPSHWFSQIRPLFYVAAYNNAGGVATYGVETRKQAEPWMGQTRNVPKYSSSRSSNWDTKR